MTQGGRAAKGTVARVIAPNLLLRVLAREVRSYHRIEARARGRRHSGRAGAARGSAPAEVTSPTARRRYARRAGSGTSFGAAQPLAILFHHRAQHLLAGLETETEERGARVGEHIEQWQRHLNRGDGRGH